MNDDVRTARTGYGSRPPHRPPDSVGLILERSRDVLRVAASVAGQPELAPARASLDLLRTDRALHAAEHILVDQLDQHGPDSTVHAQIAAVLAQLGLVRASIRETRLAGRSAAVTHLHLALGRLRGAASITDLASQVPVEINRIGYNRSLFSRLRGSTWRARGAFAHADPELADALVEVGNAVPGQLGRELPETEVVRRRAAVLVEDAQHSPRVHHRLINLANTKDYVVAPLIGRGEVIGLLHADQQVETDKVDDFDRELLGLFAEGLGCAFERTMLYEQLGDLRDRLRDQARSVGDLIDGFLDGDILSPGPRPAPAVLAPANGPLADLTRRELEVLRHLADGRTNPQIAAALFVSTGTVKTHVKNLLRKLGAANRAEAVARYHTLARHDR